MEFGVNLILALLISGAEGPKNKLQSFVRVIFDSNENTQQKKPVVHEGKLIKEINGKLKSNGIAVYYPGFLNVLPNETESGRIEIYLSTNEFKEKSSKFESNLKIIYYHSDKELRFKRHSKTENAVFGDNEIELNRNLSDAISKNLDRLFPGKSKTNEDINKVEL